MIVATLVLALASPPPPPLPPGASPLPVSGSPLPAATASPLPTAVPGVPGPASPPLPSGSPGTPQPLPVRTVLPRSAPASAAPVASPAAGSGAVPLSAYAYRYVPRHATDPDPAGATIFAVYLNAQKLRSLGPIAIRVETTPGVVKVVSRSNGREGNVPQVSPGVFVANSRLPKLPFIASGIKFTIDFVATSGDGRKVVVKVPVELD